ncbi:VCBS repeat-containing protein [Bremerella sp. JC770]|uniref:FG-GAP repeat domain-containing protein n=1 Tax=Bremerella sp. JC770 TaxID=3232137 RepID=UPI003458C357
MNSQITLLLLSGVLLLPVCQAFAQSEFDAPILIEADGEYIDTGSVGGHTGPCLVDLDKDGLRDIVVGSYDGKFRYYRNIGDDQAPKYTFAGHLQSEGEDAEVRIYCCIGSSPYFVDLNGDGALDMLSGSYSPSLIWFFPGMTQEDGPLQMGPKRGLIDQDGKKIQSKLPATWPVTVDWDSDGDLDLVFGTGHDGILVRINVGTKEEPIFDAKQIIVQEVDENGSRNASVPRGHAAVNVGDWDRDGLFDLIVGDYSGAVYWFRNKGSKTEPVFAPAQVLIPQTIERGSGSGIPQIAGETPTRGIRSQICVTDYDQDGWLDILVGDYSNYLYFDVKPDATEQQRAEFLRLARKTYEIQLDLSFAMDDYLSQMRNDFQGSDEDFWKHSEQYELKWHKHPDQLKQKEQISRLHEQKQRFLVGQFGNVHQEKHGYLWLYRRNPAEAKSASSQLAASPHLISRAPIAQGTQPPGMEAKSSDIVKWDVHATAKRTERGVTVDCDVQAHIDLGYHIGAIHPDSKFAIPTKIKVHLPPAFQPKPLALPETIQTMTTMGMQNAYEGSPIFKHSFRATDADLPTSIPVEVSISYLACTETDCLTIQEKTIRVDVAIPQVAP